MDFGLAAAPLGAPSPTLGVMLVPRHRDQPGSPWLSHSTRVPLARKRCVCLKINTPAALQTAGNSLGVKQEFELYPELGFGTAWLFLSVMETEMLFKNYCSCVQRYLFPPVWV